MDKLKLIILLFFIPSIALSSTALSIGEQTQLTRIRIDNLAEQLSRIGGGTTPTMDINVGLAERATLKTPSGSTITLTKTLPMTITPSNLAAQSLKVAKKLRALSLPSIIASAVVGKMLSDTTIKICSTQTEAGWLPQASVLPPFLADICTFCQQTQTNGYYSKGLGGFTCYGTQGRSLTFPTTTVSGTATQVCSNASSVHCGAYRSACQAIGVTVAGTCSITYEGIPGQCRYIETPTNTILALTVETPPTSITNETPLSQQDSDTKALQAYSQMNPNDVFDKTLSDINNSGYPTSDDMSPIPLDTPITSGTQSFPQSPYTLPSQTKLNPDGSTSTISDAVTPTVTATTTGTNLGNQVTNWTITNSITTTNHNNTTNTTTTTTTTDTKPADNQEQSDLCKLHPDILACMQVGQVQETNEPPLQDFDVQTSFEYTSVDGVCPPARTVHSTILSRDFSFEWTPICDYATALKPLLLAVSLIFSAYIMLGMKRAD